MRQETPKPASSSMIIYCDLGTSDPGYQVMKGLQEKLPETAVHYFRNAEELLDALRPAGRKPDIILFKQAKQPLESDATSS